METDSNLNGKLAYTVRHPLSREICPRRRRISLCRGEVLAKDGRQLRRPDDHSHDKETTANCLIIRNVFSRVETDSNLNETLAYTVRHPLSLEICRAFLKCSTGPWADTAATVQPHW